MSDPVLVCGDPLDSSVALVLARLARVNVPYAVLWPAGETAADASFQFEVRHGQVAGRCRPQGEWYRLEELSGAYLRFADRPTVAEPDPEEPAARPPAGIRAWREAVARWSDVTPIRVVNRRSLQSSTCSRPLQAQTILRHGFHVPDTLVTSDPELALAFINTHSRVVCTSTSGSRLARRDRRGEGLARLDRIRWCPAQFQEQVDGHHVVAHVVANEVFATGVERRRDDGGWPRTKGAAYQALKPSDDLAARCITLAMDLDLPFAGLNLQITPANEVYCLGVDPEPAYGECERQTGQPISAALVRYLSGGA